MTKKVILICLVLAFCKVASADFTNMQLHVGGLTTVSPTSIDDFVTIGTSTSFVKRNQRLLGLEETLSIGAIGGSWKHVAAGISSYLVFPVWSKLDLKAGINLVYSPRSDDSTLAVMGGGRFNLTPQIGLDLLVGRSTLVGASSYFGMVAVSYAFWRFGKVVDPQTIPNTIQTALVPPKEHPAEPRQLPLAMNILPTQ